MEILVDEIISEIMENHDICKCDKCIDDIRSIALNNLTPEYFVSSTNEGEKKAFLLDRQRRISVLTKVVEAIEIVSKNEHNK